MQKRSCLANESGRSVGVLVNPNDRSKCDWLMSSHRRSHDCTLVCAHDRTERPELKCSQCAILFLSASVSPKPVHLGRVAQIRVESKSTQFFHRSIMLSGGIASNQEDDTYSVEGQTYMYAGEESANRTNISLLHV